MTMAWLVEFVLFLSLASSCWSLTQSSSSFKQIGRRDAISAGLLSPLIVINLPPSPSKAAALPVTSDSDLAVKGKSVLVLGANGGTGKECVKAALASGRRCVATSRSGNLNYDVPSSVEENLAIVRADVTSYESLQGAVRLSPGKIGAIIFAASASTKGGDAFQVDRNGVVNAARCCIDNNIERFVLVSSGTVTRPDSVVYKLLNTVGKGIMEAKIQGEDIVRQMYNNPEVVQKKLGYTVVRPGGLTNDDAEPTSAVLELNQGDTKSGRLSRANVAALCIRCLDSPETFDATFECYEALTAKPIESVGLSNILKSKDPTTYKSGKERRGDTWIDIFHGLERDFDITTSAAAATV